MSDDIVASQDFFKGDDLRYMIATDKYALRDEKGNVAEKTFREMSQRVAREISSVEGDNNRINTWEANFRWLLEDFQFIPGGRILFGAKQNGTVSILNSYFIPLFNDCSRDMFRFCAEAYRTSIHGGGIGTNLNMLSPKNMPFCGLDIASVRLESFIKLLSATIGSALGPRNRPCALSLAMHADHPSIFEFIDAKRGLNEINFASTSAVITDDFMQAVERDGDFTLRFRRKENVVSRVVRARSMWERLTRSIWASSEPGVIFWDNVKRGSPSEYNGIEVKGFSTCAELFLEDYGCAPLGNINLSTFVKYQFSKEATLDWEHLETAVRFAVRFLDDALDYNLYRYPLPQQQKTSTRSRRIGLGFTGFADMLIKLSLKYGETASIRFADNIFRKLKNIAYEASSVLAHEKGSFPAFDPAKHLRRPFIKHLDATVQDKIRRYGLRNASLLTIAPVASGSILAGCSSGIEPLFGLCYTRYSQSLNKNKFRVVHPLVTTYMRLFKLVDCKQLPNFFVTAHEVDPGNRILMQATIQKHIDSGISSTVNLPSQISKDDVSKILFLSWKAGCKGITIFREGSRDAVIVPIKAT